MIADILTVIWKERRSLFRHHGSRLRAIFSLVVPIAVFGILLPWQEGSGWIEGFWSIITCVFIPLLLVGTIIPESFAGERERHTLETLLSSRLPDQAILFGKIIVAIIYGWGMTLIVLLLGLIIANATGWEGQIILFPPIIALADVVVSLLLAAIMASLGVFISLKSATVQGATQMLMATTLFPILILGISFTFIFSMKGDLSQRIKNALESLDQTQAVLITIAVLFVICSCLFWAAAVRFKRQKLIGS
ncbi:MAG TPA: ABC transporter permease [Dehalococcoidia bacterium]|nr:ABC transporter permease [Dehalococcoidia bacterium]